METAAAVEIDQGGLRRYFLEDFHRCLEKPRTTLGFSTVTTGSAAINQKPTTNKTGQITCYQNRTFLLATDTLKSQVVQMSLAPLRGALIHVGSFQGCRFAPPLANIRAALRAAVFARRRRAGE